MSKQPVAHRDRSLSFVSSVRLPIETGEMMTNIPMAHVRNPQAAISPPAMVFFSASSRIICRGLAQSEEIEARQPDFTSNWSVGPVIVRFVVRSEDFLVLVQVAWGIYVFHDHRNVVLNGAVAGSSAEEGACHGVIQELQ
jgi:hypothetical protein